MKNFTLTVTLFVFSLATFATEHNPTLIHSPRVYIMMKHGKMIEVMNGRKKLVKKDITLRNETTIHPNGVIDVSSGETKKLQEGEYITMDGRIRKLKEMIHTRN